MPPGIAPRWSGRSWAAAYGLGHDPDPDWPATVSILLDAGASTDGIVLSPDDQKPPSPEVAALLRARGIPDEADSLGLPGRSRSRRGACPLREIRAYHVRMRPT